MIRYDNNSVDMWIGNTFTSREAPIDVTGSMEPLSLENMCDEAR